MLYLSIFIFKKQLGLFVDQAIDVPVFSIQPFFRSEPYILCEENSILRTHPYFQGKLKIEMNNPSYDTIYTYLYRYLKEAKPYSTKFVKSKMDLYNPEILKKVFDKENELVETERIDYLENYGKILGIKIEPNVGFSRPNTLFPGVIVEYYQDESGEIVGRLHGKLEE